MTRLEKSSQRKCKALKNLVDRGEYSVFYAILVLEEFYDNGKVVESDYEELSEYLESLIEEPTIEEPIEEPTNEIEGE